MDPKKIAALALTTALAGMGIGRATVSAPPAPTFQRICIEADGSAQLYTDAHKQLLIPPDHALAVMHREGGKALDIVPPKLSAAIKALVPEAVAAVAGAK